MTHELSDYDNAVLHFPQKLTNEDKKYAVENLNETDENRENTVAEIKHCIENELHIQIDDFLILRFLRVCNFDLEKTKTRMRNYYKQRSNLPEWYLNTDPFRSELQQIFDIGIFLPLRKPDHQGRLVILFRGTRHDPSIHEVADICKASILLTEVAVKYYPAASVYGCAVFVDMINPTMRHILQYRPNMLRNTVHTWQNCYPLKFQTINFFNTPALVDIMVNIIRSFMTEKMKNRFHVYSHTLKCFENIPANILPVEYGGTDGTCEELAAYWKKLAEDNRDWLMSNEDKRSE